MSLCPQKPKEDVMKVRKTFTALAVGLAILAAGVTVSAKPPKTQADHEALMAKYEKLAADQEALVAEHEQMKKDKKAIQATLPKQTREKTIAEMEDHCDAIITSAKKLSDEYKGMALWHKMRAEELAK
jgi:outer membrane murein-binding lipoprotein Lpp